MNKKFKVSIRCDSERLFGLGHVSRCISIANELIKLNCECFFYIKAPSNVKKYIQSLGHTVFSVPSTVHEEKIISFKKKTYDLIIIDTKIINKHVISSYKKFGPVVYIDDNISNNLNCDMIINNNIWIKKNKYSYKNETRHLLGPKYNTVSPDYFKINHKNRLGLLISMGGEDEHDNTSWIINRFENFLNEFDVNICIGPLYSNADNILNLAKKKLKSYKIFYSPNNLIEPMKLSKFAIVSGGTTCYELAAERIVMGIIIDDENQIKIHDNFCKKKLGLSIGMHNERDDNSLKKLFKSFQNKKLIDQIIQNQMKYFPRSGVLILAKKLENFILSKKYEKGEINKCILV